MHSARFVVALGALLAFFIPEGRCERGNIQRFDSWGARSDQAIDPDRYESDDSFSQANVYELAGYPPQKHNFHVAGDRDWSKFYGLEGKEYSIGAENVGLGCDVQIRVYGSGGTTLLAERDRGSVGEDEWLSWTPPGDGIYFVMIQHVGTAVVGYGIEASYELVIGHSGDGGNLPGFLLGAIVDMDSGRPIDGATISTDGGGSAISLSDGSCTMLHSPGVFALIAQASGYETARCSGIIVGEGLDVTIKLRLTPVYLNQNPARQAPSPCHCSLEQGDGETCLDDDDENNGEEDDNWENGNGQKGGSGEAVGGGGCFIYQHTGGRTETSIGPLKASFKAIGDERR